jgi:hypothetical protein
MYPPVDPTLQRTLAQPFELCNAFGEALDARYRRKMYAEELLTDQALP